MAHVTISPAARRILDAIAGFAADDAIVERTLTASGDNVGRATVTLAEAAIASMAKAPTSRTDAQRALTSAAGNAKSLALAIASAAACELPNPAALRGWNLLKLAESPAEAIKSALSALSAARRAVGEQGPDAGQDCMKSPSTGKLTARGAYGATPAQLAYRALRDLGASLADMADLRDRMAVAEAAAKVGPAAKPRAAKKAA